MILSYNTMMSNSIIKWSSVHCYTLSSDYKPWLSRNIEDNHTFHSWCTSSWFPWTHIRTLQPWTNSASLFPIHSFLLEIISILFDICYHCEFGCICSFASHSTIHCTCYYWRYYKNETYPNEESITSHNRSSSTVWSNITIKRLSLASWYLGIVFMVSSGCFHFLMNSYPFHSYSIHRSFHIIDPMITNFLFYRIRNSLIPHRFHWIHHIITHLVCI